MFTRRAVTGHLEPITAAADDLVWWCKDDAARGTAVDLHELGMRYALDALGRTVFGDDVTEVASTLRAVLPLLGDHLARRSLAPVRSPHWFPSPANRRAERWRTVVNEVADRLIANRRASGATGTDLLSRLLTARDPETGQQMSDDEVRDEVVIFLIAGHETTGSVLALTLHLLGHDEEAQERVRDEGLDAAGGATRSSIDIDRLPYTTQVVNEAMRLFPPAHTVVRRATQETELLGYPVDEGRIVAVSIWGIHHNPSVWSDPFTFLPDRFQRSGAPTENSRRGGGYTFLPFGGGPRACIGEHLAMAELVTAVATLVTTYRLRSLLAAPELEVDLTLRPRSPLPCMFEAIPPPPGNASS